MNEKVNMLIDYLKTKVEETGYLKLNFYKNGIMKIEILSKERIRKRMVYRIYARSNFLAVIVKNKSVRCNNNEDIDTLIEIMRDYLKEETLLFDSLIQVSLYAPKRLIEIIKKDADSRPREKLQVISVGTIIREHLFEIYKEQMKEGR